MSITGIIMAAVIARDSLGFKVYLMKWNKGRKDCTVEIEEI